MAGEADDGLDSGAAIEIVSVFESVGEDWQTGEGAIGVDDLRNTGQTDAMARSNAGSYSTTS